MKLRFVVQIAREGISTLSKHEGKRKAKQGEGFKSRSALSTFLLVPFLALIVSLGLSRKFVFIFWTI